MNIQSERSLMMNRSLQGDNGKVATAKASALEPLTILLWIVVAVLALGATWFAIQFLGSIVGNILLGVFGVVSLHQFFTGKRLRVKDEHRGMTYEEVAQDDVKKKYQDKGEAIPEGEELDELVKKSATGGLFILIVIFGILISTIISYATNPVYQVFPLNYLAIAALTTVIYTGLMGIRSVPMIKGAFSKEKNTEIVDQSMFRFCIGKVVNLTLAAYAIGIALKTFGIF